MDSPVFEQIGCVVRVPAPPGAPDGVQFMTAESFELAVAKDAYWGAEFTELPTSFLDTTDRAVIDEIMAHLNVWPGRLRFVWSQAGGIVRITTGAGGYWSTLGKGALQVPPGQPTMNLQWAYLRNSASERRRVIPHEGGHARGYWHEHLREAFVRDIDPARAYPYYAANQGWSRAMVDANVLRPVSEATIMATPPDGHSIMAYPIPGSITYSGNPIVGGTDLTETDRAFDLTIYPRPVTPAPPPVGPPGEPQPPVEPPKPEPPPPPPPTEPDVTNLSPGKWSEYRDVAPGRSTVFRFAVGKKGRFSVLVDGTVKPSVSLLVAPGGKGEILGADPRSFPSRRDPTGRFDLFRRGCVYRLKAGVYDLMTGGRDEHRDTPGRVRARVASL